MQRYWPFLDYRYVTIVMVIPTKKYFVFKNVERAFKNGSLFLLNAEQIHRILSCRLCNFF